MNMSSGISKHQQLRIYYLTPYAFLHCNAVGNIATGNYGNKWLVCRIQIRTKLHVLGN